MFHYQKVHQVYFVFTSHWLDKGDSFGIKVIVQISVILKLFSVYSYCVNKPNQTLSILWSPGTYVTSQYVNWAYKSVWVAWARLINTKWKATSRQHNYVTFFWTIPTIINYSVLNYTACLQPSFCYSYCNISICSSDHLTYFLLSYIAKKNSAL